MKEFPSADQFLISFFWDTTELLAEFCCPGQVNMEDSHIQFQDMVKINRWNDQRQPVSQQLNSQVGYDYRGKCDSWMIKRAQKDLTHFPRLIYPIKTLVRFTEWLLWATHELQFWMAEIREEGRLGNGYLCPTAMRVCAIC